MKPSSSIHTTFIGFTIDVVFLERGWRVLKVATVPPFRESVARRTKLVLKLPEGKGERAGVCFGHQLKVFDIEG